MPWPIPEDLKIFPILMKCELLTDAGFQQVEIEPVSITARYSNPEEFLAWEIGVGPLKLPRCKTSMPRHSKRSWPPFARTCRRPCLR